MPAWMIRLQRGNVAKSHAFAHVNEWSRAALQHAGNRRQSGRTRWDQQ